MKNKMEIVKELKEELTEKEYIEDEEIETTPRQDENERLHIFYDKAY